jgi:hypothetical protein
MSIPAPPLPDVELVAEDKENWESSWHRSAIAILIELTTVWLRNRNDY